MEPRARIGVSGYLEVFLLIGIALGGSGIVLGAAVSYAGSLASPSVTIVEATIRQGSYAAVERVTLVDTGQKALGSIVLSTTQPLASASYCYSALDPSSGALLSSTCPNLQTNPSSVNITASVAPGRSVLVELVIKGEAFALGSSHIVTITTSSGAQESASVLVLPA